LATDSCFAISVEEVCTSLYGDTIIDISFFFPSCFAFAGNVIQASFIPLAAGD
jgi:hypothetical protein